MIPVYRAGWQGIKVRVVMIASLMVLAISIWCGLDLVQSYGLRPADGGVLAPWWQRVAFGGFVASLGVALAVGMWIYGGHYALRIEFDADAKQFHLITLSFLWNRRHVFAADALGYRRGHGEINWDIVLAGIALGHPVALVDAPWTSVRIKAWRWPLVVDQQGIVLHEKLMRTFFVR